MSPDFFRIVMHQVAPMTEEVCLHLMGEPLGHPKLGELISICQEFGTPVNLTTNGVLLHGDRFDFALLPIIRQINVSVHSFEANFQGRDVTPYMQRLFKFTHTARTKRPDMYINYRLWDLDSASAASDTNFRIRSLIADEFSVDFSTMKVDVRRKKGYHLVDRVYLNFDSRFEWPNPRSEYRSSVGTCHGLSSHIGIHADGSVVPCCLDKEANINLGDLKSTKLSEILASDRATAMREGFKQNRLVEDLCQRCTFISRFDRKVGRAENRQSPN